MESNGSQNVGIVNSWTLVDFAKAHGRMAVGTAKNSDGEEFKSTSFTAPNGVMTFVSFSSKLDSIDTTKSEKEIAMQIAAQKDSLQVIQLASGSHKLCRKGESTWESVDLGI